MRRRTFLAGSLAAAAAVATGGLAGCGSSGGEGAGPRLAWTAGATDEQRRYGDTVLTRRAPRSDAPNVLMISLDDANDWWGFLNNHPGTKTPNLDALAARSMVFSKAYPTAPMCLPSRTSVLFGERPYKTSIYDNYDASMGVYKQYAPKRASLVDDFWAAGYDTISAGKLFNDAEKPRWTKYRNTEYYLDGVFRPTNNPPGRYDPNWLSPYDGQPIGNGEHFTTAMIDFGPNGVTADKSPEGEAATWLTRRLAEPRDRPFFMAYGSIATHVPWRVPQKYFDMHPLDQVVVPEFRPEDLADLGEYARTKIIDQDKVFDTLYKSGVWQKAVQAYQAAQSYCDDEVGRVLDALASSPYADNTIVVVWSDHGQHLGEKLHFLKFALWEPATHIPFVIHAPRRWDTGQRFDKPVSTLDVGPTLAELAGIELHEPDHAGTSLVPVVGDPPRADQRPAITTWQAGNHSVRKDKWRYIRYRTGETELYDLEADPREYTNLSSQAQYAPVMAELDAFLPPAI